MPDARPKTVLVLGASGFIGSRLVAALSTSRRYQPIAASRRSAGLTLDATDPAAMRAALRNADRVVTCIAGNNRAMVRSTRALCDAARQSPPGRIVHLSSMAVYGAAVGTVREDHPTFPPAGAYAQAKIASEQIIRSYTRDGGNAVILRPTCVFGPGSPQWTTRLARLLQARRIGDLGPAGDGRCNLAFIDDVVTAIIHALDAPDIEGQAFNLSSSAALTWNEFLVRFALALGATPVQRIAPGKLKLETMLLAPLRKLLGEAITPALATLWAQDIRIDSSAAVTALAMPQTPPDTMIAAAVQWLRSNP
jgi:nucleoside-diphosphate-sugar epimerase